METYTHYKNILEKERIKLEGELGTIGTHDPMHKENWDVKMSSIDVMEADENEVADRFEEMHIDSIVLDELEARYRAVLHALKKIDINTYGICEICASPIEDERLVANPSARTCTAHMDKEDALAL
ncbi:MAG: hypothetical protein KBD24_01765 [Candidatus Pacebacteria bacterium]|nr:hypothetical protein [Candidatus Paceibacterota bacterium]